MCSLKMKYRRILTATDEWAGSVNAAQCAPRLPEDDSPLGRAKTTCVGCLKKAPSVTFGFCALIEWPALQTGELPGG